jgi:hypothetical protein
MPYDERDPRSQMATATLARRAAGASFAPQYFEFDELAPDEVTAAGTRTWLVRSQNCCVAYSSARAGDTLRRDGQPDEYMVLLPPAAEGTDGGPAATVSTPAESQDVGAGAVVVVPPGESSISVHRDGPIVRVFSTVADDLVAACSNAAVYAEADPNVTPFAPWPDPPTGHRIRVYRLDDYPPDGQRFGRILRCSTVMVNYFEPEDAPRDPSRLSPHHHDDFEQLSLQLAGDYLHHMRTPWTTDMADWRDDEHQTCASPAVTVIPPPVIHTTQSMGHMRHQLVDIFCPPRLDFSERPGWVLNADEYPMPG